MILVGMGANLEHPVYGAPLNSLEEAVRVLKKQGVKIIRQSSWYRTEPVPVSDQPWFVNAVLAVETKLDMPSFLSFLHEVEQGFGRVRDIKWEARVLDLDLLAYHEEITENTDQAAGGVVPHPFMQERAFVLAPLCEILPDWQHPLLKHSASELLAALGEPPAFEIVPVKAP
ncbi:MAG: 2-amino-4-hydroxy-6-hydroxymethyldihydropteridine diphosphokinase [Sneathiella sp.]